ncbi:hypothetical protein DERP_001665 [Dermatophagoides pteronyssinus]|nr:hypothetical protein DERP_001665 [Dermatophagoides pteronyssinus]
MKFMIIISTTMAAMVIAAPKPQVLYSNTFGGALGPLSTGQYRPVAYYSQLPPLAKPIAYTAAPKPIRYSAPSAALVEHEENYPPQPFSYSYDTVDEYGTQMTRQESGDGAGTVRGSYSYRDANGMARIVNYIADHNGFRAEIQTNEPGTQTSNPADAVIISSNPSAYKQQ